MRILLLVLLLSGCASGDHLYGPAEYLHDTYGVEIQSIHPDYYEKFWSPDIVYHEGIEPCDAGDRACAIATPERCDVYLPGRYSPTLEAHELKHCFGWSHQKRDPKREASLAYQWHPTGLSE